MREYTLTASVFKRFRSMGYAIRCYRCGKSLKIGDRIVSKRRTHVVHLYHSGCYQELFFSDETIEEKTSSIESLDYVSVKKRSS